MQPCAMISCLCLLLPAGVGAEECSPAVLARRGNLYVPAGGSVSLSCVVQHCGHTWSGSWIWKSVTNETSITDSERHRLTRVELSDNQTRLLLNFPSVGQSDEGSYGCKATWAQEDDTDVGHLTYVNVTSTTSVVPSQRTLWHRLLVCGSVALCLPVFLGLACCLRSRVEAQPLPLPPPSAGAAESRDRGRPPPPPQHAAPRSPQKTEVVYADISREALREHRGVREPAPTSTVYSTVRFS